MAMPSNGNSFRSRKAIFEEKLKRHEKDLDLFRRFDPPLLNIDLLTEVVGKIDEIHNNLLVSLSVAGCQNKNNNG